MRYRHVVAAAASPLLALSSCNEATPPVVPVMAALGASAVLTDHVVISEFRVRGPNGGSDEFVELYNPTALPVDISGWKLRGSNSSGSVSVRATVTSRVLPPGGFFLFTNAATGGYSGTVAGNMTYGTGITDDGGVAISLPDGVTNVDQVGMSTGSAFKEGTPLANLGSSNLNRAYARKTSPGGCPSQDTGNNATDFIVLTPSDPRNAASASCLDNVVNLSGTGEASPATVGAGATTVLTVSVVPAEDPGSTGIAVMADLSSIGGSLTQQLYDDGQGADATAADNVFTYSAAIPVDVAPGQKSLPVSISDAQARQAGTAIQLTIEATTTADVRIVELHYDNDGTDTGEGFKVIGPAGTSLAGWSVVFYNGNGGASYGTVNLSGLLGDQCDGRGTAAFTFNGIQNGAPDGLALVGPGNVVVEFLSYEGVFSATNGPAAGMTSVDIGRDEDGDETPGLSLQKDALGWYGPNPSSFGACNVAPPPFVSISGDPTIPVGFEIPLFATLNDGRGSTTPSTFTFELLTPGTATLDANAILHAVSAGPATVRATAATGGHGHAHLHDVQCDSGRGRLLQPRGVRHADGRGRQ